MLTAHGQGTCRRAQAIEGVGRAHRLVGAPDGLHRPTAAPRHVRDVRDRHQRTQQGDRTGEGSRRARLAQRLHPLVRLGAHEGGERIQPRGPDGVGRRPVGPDQAADPGIGVRRPARQPEGLAAEQHREFVIDHQLGLGRDLAVQGGGRRPGFVEPEDAPRRLEEADDAVRVASGGLHQAGGKGRSSRVDDVVGQYGGDDVAPQPVAFHLRLEPGQGLGEIGFQSVQEEGVVGRGALDDVMRQFQLAIGQEHRQFGTGEAFAGGAQLVDGGRPRQSLDAAIQASVGDQLGHEARMGVQVPRRAGLLQAQRQGLVVIVLQHVR